MKRDLQRAIDVLSAQIDCHTSFLREHRVNTANGSQAISSIEYSRREGLISGLTLAIETIELLASEQAADSG